MREELMARRMRYLQTILRRLRAEISTDELIVNPKLLEVIRSFEFQLRQMEVAYVGSPRPRKAV